MKLKLLSLAGLLLLAGCGKTVTVPHPNAIDSFDSKTFDALTVAQAALDEAKNQYALGKLPVNSKVVINDAGNAYNSVRDAWLGYRAYKTAGKDASDYVAKINALLPQLNSFINDLQTLLGKKTSWCPTREWSFA